MADDDFVNSILADTSAGGSSVGVGGGRRTGISPFPSQASLTSPVTGRSSPMQGSAAGTPRSPTHLARATTDYTFQFLNRNSSPSSALGTRQGSARFPGKECQPLQLTSADALGQTLSQLKAQKEASPLKLRTPGSASGHSSRGARTPIGEDSACITVEFPASAAAEVYSDPALGRRAGGSSISGGVTEETFLTPREESMIIAASRSRSPQSASRRLTEDSVALHAEDPASTSLLKRQGTSWSSGASASGGYGTTAPSWREADDTGLADEIASAKLKSANLSGRSLGRVTSADRIRGIGADSPRRPQTLKEKADEERQIASTTNIPGSPSGRVASLLRYSLLFINFTLNTAGLLLMMAGFVTRQNSAINLCHHCSRLTIAPIVVGGFLWLASAYGFNWLRQRNMLMLLAYAGTLVLTVLTLLAMLATALVFDQANYSGGQLLANWENAVINDPQSICLLQQRFNCSGYHYNCCRSPLDYFNPSLPNEDQNYCFGQDGNIPSWAYQVCPRCKDQILNNTNVCTDVVYRTMRRNLVGFSVIVAIAISLIILGLLVAVLTRKQRISSSPRPISTMPLLDRSSDTQSDR